MFVLCKKGLFFPNTVGCMSAVSFHYVICHYHLPALYFCGRFVSGRSYYGEQTSLQSTYPPCTALKFLLIYGHLSVLFEVIDLSLLLTLGRGPLEPVKPFSLKSLLIFPLLTRDCDRQWKSYNQCIRLCTVYTGI